MSDWGHRIVHLRAMRNVQHFAVGEKITHLRGYDDIVEVVGAVVALAPPGRSPTPDSVQPPVVAERFAARLVRRRRIGGAAADQQRGIPRRVVRYRCLQDVSRPD